MKTKTRRIAVKHQLHYASGQKPKVGDVVKCLDNTMLGGKALHLNKRKHYTVEQTGFDDLADRSLAAEVKLTGTTFDMFYHARRFELVRRAS